MNGTIFTGYAAPAGQSPRPPAPRVPSALPRALTADDRGTPLCGSFGAELDAGEGKKWNLLFPRGEWHGRNLESIGGKINLTDAVFAEMIANWEAMGRPKLPIRKTHLHLDPSVPAKDRPDLEVSFGDLEDLRITAAGLEALTDWNDEGRALVKSRKFRSWSPEWYPTHVDRRTGERKGQWLSGTALTNDPFFITMPPVAASTSPTEPNPQHRSNTMNEEQLKLRASLGLAATATDAEVLAAQTKQAGELAALKASAKPTVDAEAITAAVKAVVDPMQTQLTAAKAETDALKASLLDKDVDALIARMKRGDGKMGRAIVEASMKPVVHTLIASAKTLAEGFKAAEDFIATNVALSVPITATAQQGTTEAPLTAAAASEKLQAEVEKLTKDGNITPWLSAVARNPELARIAQEGK